MRRAGYDPREAGKVWGNLLDELRATPTTIRRRTACCSRRTRRPTSGATRWARSRPDNPATPSAAAFRDCIAPLRRDLLDDEVKRARPAETLVLLDRLLHRSPRSLICCTHGAKPGASAMRSATSASRSTTSWPRSARVIEPPATHRSLGYLYRAPETRRRAQRIAAIPGARAERTRRRMDSTAIAGDQAVNRRSALTLCGVTVLAGCAQLSHVASGNVTVKRRRW